MPLEEMPLGSEPHQSWEQPRTTLPQGHSHSSWSPASRPQTCFCAQVPAGIPPLTALLPDAAAASPLASYLPLASFDSSCAQQTQSSSNTGIRPELPLASSPPMSLDTHGIKPKALLRPS